MKTTLYTLCFSICLTVLAVSCSRTRTMRTPDETWKYVTRAYRSRDATGADIYTTETGKKAAEWLFTQPWIDGELEAQILQKTQEGDHYEVREQIVKTEGRDVIKLIFSRKQGVWQFEDIYVETWKDEACGMNLSYILDHPTKAGAWFFVENPGKILSAAEQTVALVREQFSRLIKALILAILAFAAIASGGVVGCFWILARTLKQLLKPGNAGPKVVSATS